MLLHLKTYIDGSQKFIAGFSITTDTFASVPAPTDTQMFIDVDTIAPVTVESLANNFEKYEIVSGAIVLQSGKTLSDRVIDPGDIDDTIPMTLNRSNKVSIFQNL